MSASIFAANGLPLAKEEAAPSLGPTMKSTMAAHFERAKQATLRALSDKPAVKGRKLANEFSVQIDDTDLPHDLDLAGPISGPKEVKVLYQRPRITHKPRPAPPNPHPYQPPQVLKIKRASVTSSASPAPPTLSQATMKRLQAASQRRASLDNATTLKPVKPIASVKKLAVSVDKKTVMALKKTSSAAQQSKGKREAENGTASRSTDLPSKEKIQEKRENVPHAQNRFKDKPSEEIQKELRAKAAKQVREEKERQRLEKAEKEAKELEIKQMLEQARTKLQPAKGGKRSESLFDRAKREKLEREQAEVREMREKRRVAAEKRKSAGREAVGTHILSQKAIARIHAERQRAREEQLQEEQNAKKKSQRPVSAAPRFNADLEEQDYSLKGKEGEALSPQKRVLYQNFIKEHFEREQRAARDKKLEEENAKKQKEAKLRALTEKRREAFKKPPEKAEKQPVRMRVKSATVRRKKQPRNQSLSYGADDIPTDSEAEMGELIQAAAAMKISIRVAAQDEQQHFEDFSESIVPAIECEAGETERPPPPAFNQSSIAKQPSEDPSGQHEEMPSNPFRHQILIEKYQALKERAEELKRRDAAAGVAEPPLPVETKEVLVELYEPPKPEPAVEIAGAGEAEAESSVEELYAYNEKKAWREPMTTTATQPDSTTVATQDQRRVVVGNLKARPHPPLARPPGVGDMHQTLEEQKMAMKQQKWEAAMKIQRNYRGYLGRKRAREMRDGMDQIELEIKKYQDLFLSNTRRFEFPPQSRFISQIGPLRELGAPKDKTFQERAKDLRSTAAHTPKDTTMKTADQSVKSISTRASTSADYDPLNMVDALFRVNPDLFGAMVPVSETPPPHITVTEQSMGSVKGPVPHRAKTPDDEVKIMGSVEDLQRKESGSKRFGGHQYQIEESVMSEVSEVYTDDFVEESHILPKKQQGQKGPRGSALNMSDSIQESIHIAESMGAGGGRKRGKSALYESIASVPEESHLLGNDSRRGSSADVVEESLHFEKSSMRPGEVDEEQYSENFESMQESQSFLRPLRGNKSLLRPQQSPRLKGPSGLLKAAQLESEIQKKTAEKEQVALARKLAEQESELKHQKEILRLKDEQLKRWMDNSSRVQDEVSRKHVEALQSVTENFLSHLRGIAVQPVTPASRPLKVPPAQLLNPAKIISPTKVPAPEESIGQYSDDFESLDESRQPGAGGSKKLSSARIKEIKEAEESEEIFEEIEGRPDDSQYFSPDPKHEKKRSSESPFTSPGAQVADEISAEDISESIPESIVDQVSEHLSVPDEAQRSSFKETGRGEQIMESTELKSVRRSTGATSPLMGLRKSKQAASSVEDRGGRVSDRRDTSGDIPRRKSSSLEGVDSVILRLERALDRKKQKDSQALNQLLQDKKISQTDYRIKKRELDRELENERAHIRDAKRQLRSGWDRAQDLIDRLVADKQFIVSTLGGGAGGEGLEESSGGVIGASSDSMKDLHRQILQIGGGATPDPRFVKEEKELRRKREGAQKLIQQKERAIEEGLRKRLLDVEKQHVDELLDIALHMDINSEINIRAQRAIDALKQREISPDTLRKAAVAKQTAAAQQSPHRRSPRQPSVGGGSSQGSASPAGRPLSPQGVSLNVISPGGRKKPVEEDPNEISESIQGFGESLASRAQQAGAAGGVKEVTESYSEQFESDSQFYSQSVNKIVKPPPPPGKKVPVEESIKQEEESGGKISPRRSGAEDLFSSDFKSGTMESGIFKGANSSYSEDRTANSRDSVDWVLTLEGDAGLRKAQEQAAKIQKKASDALDKQLLDNTEEYSEDFQDFEDEEEVDESQQEQQQDLSPARSSARSGRSKLNEKEKQADILADLLLSELMGEAVPESVRRPRLLISRLQDKLTEQIESRKEAEEERIREERKVRKLGIKRDFEAVSSYLDSLFIEIRNGRSDASLADEINEILATPLDVSDLATPRGRSSSLKGRNSTLSRSQSGTLFSREYPDKKVFYKMRPLRVNRADLYANVSLDPLVPISANMKLKDFVEEQDERQDLMDALMKHQEMLFKTVQSAFEEWFTQRAPRPASLCSRDTVHLGGHREVLAREIKSIFGSIKQKVLGLAQSGCGVLELPQNLLLHAEAVHQKDHGDDFFSRNSKLDRGVNIGDEIEKLREKRLKDLIVKEIEQQESKWTHFAKEESRVKKELADELIDFLAEDVAQWLSEAEEGRGGSGKSQAW